MKKRISYPNYFPEIVMIKMLACIISFFMSFTDF